MASNLQFITSSSGSNVSSHSIENCFSAKYDIYKVVIDTLEFASSDGAFRFINSSGVVSSSNYDDAVHLQRSYGNFADSQSSGATSLGSIGFYDPASGVNQGKGNATIIYIYNPFNSDSYTFATWQNTGVSSIGPPVRRGVGVLKVAESHTGINFTGGATILGVKASIYGVKE